MSSWWNSKDRKKFGPVRAKAAVYADKHVDRTSKQWIEYYKAFLAGYLKSQREKFATIRLKLKQ